jgi:predicted GTPase
LPIIVAVNKIDTLDQSQTKYRFNQVVKAFHFAKWIPILPISAKKGI